MSDTVRSLEELSDLVGQHLGFSEYVTVTQEMVNLVADATGDHQWIHVDPARAAAGPFGTTIAHGYLTLSLVPTLLGRLLKVGGVSMGVNYGVNRVRFSAPVPVGAAIRAEATLVSVDEVSGGVQVTLDVLVTVRDATKPSCVAQVVFRYYR